MLATIGHRVPDRVEWVLEPKWEGIRAPAHVCLGGPRLFTRHVRAHHDRFPVGMTWTALVVLGVALSGLT
jgi:ATP-dependent DNA ligase